MKIMKVIAIGLLIMVLALVGAMVYEKYIVEPRVEAEAEAKVEAEAKAEAEAAAPQAETEKAETEKAETEVEAEAEAEKAEVEVITDEDELIGKKYYATKRSTSDFLAWLRENETVENAVSTIECAEYGNSMVVDHDDPRIVLVKATVDGEKVMRPFTVYDLYFGQEFEVEFTRNGSSLYVYKEGTEFDLSTKTDVDFKGLPDKQAFKTWCCPKHLAVYANRLVIKGYPDAEGRHGVFSTKNGLDPRLLQAIVLVETEEGRYDWCLTSCDCSSGSNGGSSNGASGGSSNGGSGSSGGSGASGGSSNGQTAHSPEGDDKGKHNPGDEPATDDSDEKDSNESFKEEQWPDGSSSSSEKDSNESFKEENWEAEKEENKTSNSQHSADDEEEKTSNSQQKAEEEENTSSNSKHTADEKEENTSSNSQQEEEKDSDEEFVLETF